MHSGVRMVGAYYCFFLAEKNESHTGKTLSKHHAQYCKTCENIFESDRYATSGQPPPETTFYWSSSAP